MPLETIMDREIIQTLIFMDFETAGPWLHSETNEELRPRDHIDDMDFTEHLAHLINTDVDPSRIPRIAEMSFVAVPRCLFEEAAENMAHRQRMVEEAIQKGICLKDESIKIDVATNLYTCQLNPGLREAEWKIYDLKKSSNRLRRSELLRKNSFAKEWPIVHLFLCNAPKPACLIAHNGLEYDFRILLHELKRFDMLNKYPIPAGVYFVDSLLSFVHIEGNHHSAIKLVFDNIDWDHVTNASQESILSSSSLHTDNVTDQAHFNNSNHEAERIEHNLVTDLVDDNDDVQFIGADCPFVENEPNDDIEILENGQENPQYEKGENRQKQEEEIMVIGENLNQNLENDRKWRNGDSEDKRFTEPHLLEADHPFQFLRRMDWCPAKRRRVPARIFNKYSKNQWYFSDQVSQLCLRQAGRYKLEKMYKNIIGVGFKAHRAQTDSEALLQLALSYGQDFLNFIDNKYAKFPFMC